MRSFIILLFLFSFYGSVAQERELPDFEAVDSLYREDQFYFGITYNILQHKSDNLDQNKVSLGSSIGFLRDMPINKKRNVSIAVGLGYSINTFNQNLLVSKDNGNYSYSYLPDGTSYDKNKFILNYIDLPVEFRWRTSTFDSHRFWRIYTGIKVSYLFYDVYKYEGEYGNRTLIQNPDLNKIQYGAYITAGYNTWNFYAYYGLNPMFKSAQVGTADIDARILNLGLMFYIL